MKKSRLTGSDSLGWNCTSFFFFPPLIEAGENLSEKVMLEFRLQQAEGIHVSRKFQAENKDYKGA